MTCEKRVTKSNKNPKAPSLNGALNYCLFIFPLCFIMMYLICYLRGTQATCVVGVVNKKPSCTQLNRVAVSARRSSRAAPVFLFCFLFLHVKCCQSSERVAAVRAALPTALLKPLPSSGQE